MGSGQAETYEQKHHTSTIPTTGAAAASVSPQTDAVYNAMINELKDKKIYITPTFYQLPYSAPSVDILYAGLKWPTGLGVTNTPGLTLKADLDQFESVNVPKYIGEESQGVSELQAYLTQIYDTCSSVGRQPMVVLAGYSQGAMVVHNVLNIIAANNETSLSAMIKGAVLIADPERMPDSDVVNFGTAAWNDYGLCHLLDNANLGSCVPPGKTTDLASSFSSIAYQLCDKGDVVCDVSSILSSNSLTHPSDIWQKLKQGGKVIHTTHYMGGEATTAGRRVAQALFDDGLSSTSPTPTPTATPTPTPSSSTSAPSSSIGSWAATEAPLPSGADGLILSGMAHVTCASASFCVAVGDYKVSALQYEGLIDMYNGSSWSTQTAPLPSQATDAGSADSQLGSVACTSATSCIAVGTYSVINQNVAGALIETLNDGTWTATTAPAPAGGSGEALGSISCASASFCVAVGQYSDSSDENVGLIETLNDGSWTVLEAPAPAGGSSEALLSVSCGAVGFCAAVNEFNAAIDTLSDGTWTATNAPLPATGVQSESLSSVACPSSESCVAVGSYRTGGQSQGLLEDLADGAWAVTQAPLPSDANSTDNASLNSVTCSSAKSCQAVGIYNEPVDPDWGEGVIDTLDNGSWTAAASENSADFNAASCAGTNCAAAGYYAAETGGLIDTASNGGWTPTEPSLPTNASTTNSPEANLTSVSCDTSGFCAAVGWYDDSTGTQQGLIETN